MTVTFQSEEALKVGNIFYRRFKLQRDHYSSKLQSRPSGEPQG